jgi:hypothetical protein
MSGAQVQNGVLELLREACEGGRPGEGTGFLDRTMADGSGNHGLFATLDALDATRASQPTALGLSVAAHAAHTAYHLEVTVRWVNGDRGPFDWPGSFEPRTVDDAGWAATRARVRAAYADVVALAKAAPEWDERTGAALAASLAHVAYHLGSLRQTAKLAR